MTPAGSAAGLGLLSALSWGGSDFAGGLGARRAPALLITASGQILSLLVLLAICMVMRLAVPAPSLVFYAAVGGFEGALALAAFYRALAMGAMGLTAALTGLLTALLPVLLTLLHSGFPAPLTALGLAGGCVAIWLITNSTGGRGARIPRAALLLGALAGIGFGAQLVLFKLASAGGVLWALTSARAAGVAALLFVLVLAPPRGRWHGFWLTGIVAGAFDTLGNLFYIGATRLGRLDVAAVICSLYPAGTILLAAVVLHEWPTRRQWAGIALALVAIALLAF